MSGFKNICHIFSEGKVRLLIDEADKAFRSIGKNIASGDPDLFVYNESAGHRFFVEVKLPAASCGASVTKQSGTAPERDTRLRQGFGAVTSRSIPTASCGASARRRVKGNDKITDNQKVLFPLIEKFLCPVFIARVIAKGTS
jgi:hypothetical protein